MVAGPTATPKLPLAVAPLPQAKDGVPVAVPIKPTLLCQAEFASLNLPTPPVNAGVLLSQVDLNRDGQVTLVEYRTGKLRNFDSMDVDKDGIVSVAEMKTGGLVK